jgi:plastocyanin
MKNTKVLQTLIACSILSAILLFGCQGNTPAPGTGQVTIASFQFSPASITIAKGATITWTNNDVVAHTVTSGVPSLPDGLFNSGSLAPAKTYSFTFETAGTFHYYCGIHSSMTGTVFVQ